MDGIAPSVGDYNNSRDCVQFQSTLEQLVLLPASLCSSADTPIAAVLLTNANVNFTVPQRRNDSCAIDIMMGKAPKLESRRSESALSLNYIIVVIRRDRNLRGRGGNDDA